LCEFESADGGELSGGFEEPDDALLGGLAFSVEAVASS